MEQVRQLVGRERSLEEISRQLCSSARRQGASQVGAIHVTCADESEGECGEAFQHGFVQYLLPPLKFARRSATRLANLGARYEWGAVPIAEDHFAPSNAGDSLLLLVKINAHVAFDPGSSRFGHWTRYGKDSSACGALAALLAGSRAPFTEPLRELFASEGRDRVACLRDETEVDPRTRALHAAIVSARLQARTAVLDIQDHVPAAPTLFAVVPCVTINRPERDTEIVVGVYTIDGRQETPEAIYCGLGDDPAAYVVSSRHGLLVVSDGEVGERRAARDHRHLIREDWQRRGSPAEVRDERLDRIQSDVAADRHRDHRHARALLRASLPILAEVAPIPTAILLFAEGAAGIHHAFRVHRLAREMSGTEDAREILDEIRAKVDQLEPDRAEALLELLVSQVRR